VSAAVVVLEEEEEEEEEEEAPARSRSIASPLTGRPRAAVRGVARAPPRPLDAARLAAVGAVVRRAPTATDAAVAAIAAVALFQTTRASRVASRVPVVEGNNPVRPTQPPRSTASSSLRGVRSPGDRAPPRRFDRRRASVAGVPCGR